MYVSVNFDLTPREPNYYGQTGLSIKECYISLFHQSKLINQNQPFRILCWGKK